MPAPIIGIWSWTEGPAVAPSVVHTQRIQPITQRHVVERRRRRRMTMRVLLTIAVWLIW